MASDSSFFRPTMSRVTEERLVLDWGRGLKKDVFEEGGLTLGVDVQCLGACDGVCSHDGVLVDDGLTALDAALPYAGVDLLDAGVSGLEAVEQLLESRRQAVVGLGGVGEEGVAARLGDVEVVEEGGAGGLLLVRDVRVPRHGADAALEEGLVGLVARGAVDQVNLRVAGGGAGCGVDVVAAEVAAEVEGLADGQVGEVLLAEGDDLALGDEAGELVLASLGQLAQLDAVDLGADRGREVRYLG